MCVLNSSLFLIPWTMSLLSCTGCSNANTCLRWKALLLMNTSFQILTSGGPPLDIPSHNPQLSLKPDNLEGSLLHDHLFPQEFYPWDSYPELSSH